MKKSLFAGATALALIAGAAFAQQAYDNTTTRTTTVTAPVAVVPVAPPTQTTTTVQQTVNPRVFDPTSSYREEHVTTQDGQVVERTTRSDTTSPQGHTTTYSQTTTGDGDE
jgi:hypothetical protein